MTDQQYISIDRRAVTDLTLTVAYAGPWYVEAHMVDDGPLPTPCVVQLGQTLLSGTPIADHDGVYGGRRRVRIQGGAGGWGTSIPAHSYHNDGGVRAQLVAADAARACGETLGDFAPARLRLGVDYVRDAGLASAALIAAAGDGVAWWVGYDGVTVVGPHPTTTPDVTAYSVLEYDPSERIATLTADDAGTIRVGAVINQDDATGTVRELSVTFEGDGAMRVTAWLGGDGQSGGQLAGLITAITEHVVSRRLYGHYRYRVVRQRGDGRLDLQAVSFGLPDLSYVTVWPGVSGAHATVTPGGLVLVVFADGDRAQPLVTHVAPYGAPGFAPAELTLGGNTGAPCARLGDTVEVVLPPMTLVGTLTTPGGPLPITGVVSPTLPNAVGTITTGSPIVRVAP